MSTNVKPKAIIFIDHSNLYYGIQRLGWEIDYKKLRQYFENNYDVINIYYYAGIHSFKSYFDTHANISKLNPQDIWEFAQSRKAKKEVFRSLKRKGYIVRIKEIASIYDNTEGRYQLKCNADVELTIDALDRMNDYDESILMSGDGDFAKLLQYLKDRGKKTIVLAIRERLSYKLKKVSNRTVYINGLRQELEYFGHKNTKGDSKSRQSHSPT